jgi:hypothetical protein
MQTAGLLVRKRILALFLIIYCIISGSGNENFLGPVCQRCGAFCQGNPKPYARRTSGSQTRDNNGLQWS